MFFIMVNFMFMFELDPRLIGTYDDNAAFKSARDTAPRLSERGEPGAERWRRLELKLVADAGLVGLEALQALAPQRPARQTC